MTDINLLFTCPHDGRKRGSEANPPIVRRNTDNFPDQICMPGDGQGFSTENDLSTKELTEKIVETIQSLTTKLPQIQIADYRRLFIDYNRKEDCAFVNSGSARTEYLKYHTGIRDKIEECFRTMALLCSFYLMFMEQVGGRCPGRMDDLTKSK